MKGSILETVASKPMGQKILTFLSSFLTLCLFAALLLLLFADFNQYRDLISEKVREATGRELTIEGNLRLKPSFSPTVVLERIQLQNSPWGSSPTMFSAGEMELELALFPLLTGEARITRIVARNTKLTLETNASGRGNWEFPNLADSSEAHPLRAIEQVELHNLYLLWRNGATGATERFHLGRLSADKTGWNAPMRLTLNGTLNGTPLLLAGNVSRHGDKKHNIRVSRFQAKLGNSDLNGDFTLSWGGQGRPFLSGDLHSQTLDLGPFNNGEKRNSEQPPRLFSSSPWPLAQLKSWDAKMGYRAKRVINGPFPIADLTTQFHLTRGKLRLDPIQFHTAHSVANGALQINSSIQPPEAQLTLHAADLDLGELFRTSLGENTLAATGEVSLELHGRGDSVAAIMSTLNGHSRLLAGKGKISAASIDEITGGLETVLDLMLSPGDQYTTMNCMASDFQIKNGVAVSRAFLLDSTHSTLFGDGTINLENERVHFVVKPKPKSATLNLAVPVEIGGTLSRPTYTLEKTSVARKAIGVVGIFAFPPAALLGLGELGTGKENPCLEIASSGDIPTDQEKDVLERGSDVIKGTVKGVGDAIKKIF